MKPSVTSGALLLALIACPGSSGAMATGGEKCAAAKTKAAGKAMSGVLKCQAVALKKGAKVDAACLQKVGDKLQDAFGRAEASGACAIMGDLPTIADLVARFSQFIDVQLIPLVPAGVACNNSDAPTCDGICPAGQFCAPVGLGDFCGCVTPSCGAIAGDPACYGQCPPEAPICASVNGSCQCTSGSLPCGQVAQGEIQCDGACPAGEVCVPGEYGPNGEIGQQCYCRPTTCGPAGIYHYAPQCWGECPADAPYCRDVGGYCQCAPSPS
jgi:hypothetical protein